MRKIDFLNLACYNNKKEKEKMKMLIPGYNPEDLEKIDESKLEPATDAEIQEAIRETLDEMDEELKEAFSEETLEREYGDFMREFEKAETIEERTAVMDKYHISY